MNRSLLASANLGSLTMAILLLALDLSGSGSILCLEANVPAASQNPQAQLIMAQKLVHPKSRTNVNNQAASPVSSQLQEFKTIAMNQQNSNLKTANIDAQKSETLAPPVNQPATQEQQASVNQVDSNLKKAEVLAAPASSEHSHKNGKHELGDTGHINHQPSTNSGSPFLPRILKGFGFGFGIGR